VTFSGFPFLFGFLPLSLAGFALFGRFGEAAAKTWLIAASLAFYASDAPGRLPLLLLSIGGNYLVLQAMHRSADAGAWVVAGVGANLAVLGYFKIDGGVPLGLSFFTFTQIGCLLHYAQGGDRPPRLRDYALFAGFFPALTAGPILNPNDMQQQFTRSAGWRVTADDVSVGLGFFLIGLLKKTLLADPLAGTVNAGYADPGGLALLPAWQAACGYSLQLYFDFSGYTDMAIGLGRMFGLRLPDNFDRPYAAPSVIAYWQRWHMSLTRFLMANVHAPLAMAVLRRRRDLGAGIGHAAQCRPAGFAAMIALPIAATMLLVSLWHGLGATFLVFGALHTVFLLVNHGWRLSRAPGLPVLAGTALTYACVLLASVFFRAASVPDGFLVLAGMAGLHGAGPPGSRDAVGLLWLAGLYAIVWFAPTTRQVMTGGAWRSSPAWGMAMGGAATLGLLSAGGTGEFLYFRF
jgi:D-alanyl-lipoteichoic acid acyltransferase DltB (MBOAT superfamily)